MSDKFSFKLNGFDKLLKDLAAIGDNVIYELDIRMASSAEAVVVNARAAVHKNTGFGEQSINYDRTAILDYKVYAKAPYLPYVEFGTGALVNVPTGLEDYAIQFKGRGIRQVNLPARPFLFPAYEEERRKLMEWIKQYLLLNSMKGITILMPGRPNNITSITTI